jgi:hypothetical protein
MENFLFMESGYHKVNPKIRKRVKWSSGYWIHGKVANWEKLNISDYVNKVDIWGK